MKHLRIITHLLDPHGGGRRGRSSALLDQRWRGKSVAFLQARLADAGVDWKDFAVAGGGR